MGKQTTDRETVRMQCICGEDLEFEAELLGRIIRCSHCERYLRPALQFLLADKSLAFNLAAQCTCGHFIVEDVRRTGKRARCKVCRNHLLMPQAEVKFDSKPLVRVPRRVLARQLRPRPGRPEREEPEVDRLSHQGRITLGPGQRFCANEECGERLGRQAIVCPKCGTNRLTGERYEGPGPGGDPRGKWREV